MRQSRSDLINNMERFARIDLDLKTNETTGSAPSQLSSYFTYDAEVLSSQRLRSTSSSCGVVVQCSG